MHDSLRRQRLQRLFGNTGSAETSRGQRLPFAPRVEELEWRLAPAAPVVLSINRASPAQPNTSAASVQYTVTFDQSVTGVDAGDFKVAATGNLAATAPVVVAGNGATYSVTINGLHGSGDLRLDLIDDDSIIGGGLSLGAAGVGNGSFQGQTYTVHQAFPFVVSIERASPSPTQASSVGFTVTFTAAVTGVDPSDFALVNTGTVAAALPQVAPVSTSVYTVTVGGITGNGTLGLNLVDDGSIRDLAGNPLTTANAPAEFAPQSTFAAGQTPGAIAVGDVNGDGQPDVAVTNYLDNTVSVLLGNGNGTFQARKTFATGTYPKALALGDVNGDGKADLAVADFDKATVSVLLGNGNGTFQARKAFASGDSPYSVTLGDVNGDGKPDLVVAIYDSLSVNVLLGNGNGTFQARKAFAAGSYAKSATLDDVNGDGKPDLVAANYADGTVSVLLGNGNGTFQARKTFATGDSPYSVKVADLNGDNKPDLAVTNYLSNTVSVLLGNGDGMFQPRQTFATGVLPEGMTLGDVNGDGKPDLAVANYYSNSASVVLGNGNGTFQPQQTFATGTFPKSVAFGDVNGDGKADLVVANAFSDAVGVYLGSGVGNFIGQTYVVDHSASAATTTTLTANPNATTGGQLVTFTATVAPSPGNLGTVTFKDNGVVLSGGANVPVVGGAASFQISSLTPGTHPITAEFSGATGFSASTSNTLNFVVSAAPPQVLGVTVNGNIASLAGPQRSRVASLRISFDQAVEFDAGALTLTRHTNSVTFNGAPQPDGFGVLPMSLNLATNDNITWTITFAGNTETGVDGINSLQDGLYDLNIDASKVHPLGVPGVNMSGNVTSTFHRLLGDTGAPTTPIGGTPNVDFEAVVNTGDNLTFRGAFNNPANYKAFLDFNGDGIINTGDNLQFRSRFNKALTWRV
jgi:hypothetical protein